MNTRSENDPRPMSHRFLDRSPVSLFWSGVLLAIGFIFVFVVMELVLGRFVEFERDTYREDLRVAFVLCLLAAYLPVAAIHSIRSAGRTAKELVPVIDQKGSAANLEKPGRFDRSALRSAGIVGVCLQFVVVILAELEPSNLGELLELSPEAYFHRIMLFWIGWFGGRLAYTIWIESKRFSEIGRDRVMIDLLDLSSVAPLGQFGLRQALVTIGLFSLTVLMFYDAQAAPNLVWVLIVMAVSTLVLAAASLFLPVRGIRDAITREKIRELARINSQIRRSLAGAETASQLSLSDWIAYRGLVQSVREWPIDAPTLRRFALYLAIPLGSWFGGALVERVLDGFLD
jgi:hypothetical protein